MSEKISNVWSPGILNYYDDKWASFQTQFAFKLKKKNVQV